MFSTFSFQRAFYLSMEYGAAQSICQYAVSKTPKARENMKYIQERAGGWKLRRVSHLIN
jgi:hypothetical protein